MNPQTRSAAQYTIKFTDTEGGTTTPDQTVDEGTQAQRPVDPARPDYSFDGWFISGTLTAYDFSQPVTSDMTLEARWTKNGDVWDLSPTQGPTAGNTLITLTAPPARTIRFSQFSAGYQYSVAVGSDGSIYHWGEMYGSDYNWQPSREDTPAGLRFIQVSAGYDHSLALDSDGNLYSWGSSSYGQLGRGANTTPITKPGKVDPPAAGVRYTQVIAKGMHCLALDSTGALYSWGYNNYNQLGRYTGSSGFNARGKVNVPTKTRLTQISAGDWNGFALDDQGILYTWGNNSHAQLARPYWGSTDSKPTKIDPPAKNVNYTQVIGGGNHAVAIGSDGNLYSWGRNSNGQLGRDTNKRDSYQPGTIPLTNHAAITSIKFGGTPGKGLAANADGTWSVTTPPHSKGWVNVTITWSMNGPQPDAYLSYTYTGPKYSVGFTSVDAACPTPSDMPADQSVIEGGQIKRPYPNPKADGCLFDGWFLKDAQGNSNMAYDFSQPVTGDITLVAHWSPANTGGWSINPAKGSSLGGQQATITPPKISRGIRFNQVSAGGYQAGDFRGFSVGVASDGNAYAWGSNQHGQLGQGTANSTTQKTPIKVPLPDGVAAGFTYTQVAAGGYHVLAVGSDGIVYSWGGGANDHGQLGDGTKTSRPSPRQVTSLTGSSQGLQAAWISSGVHHSLAVNQNGAACAWGWNTDGQLGDGNTSDQPTPMRVSPPAGQGKAGSGFTTVRTSAGRNHSLAIGQDGNAYAWGDNTYSQLGNGGTTQSSTPALVAFNPVLLITGVSFDQTTVDTLQQNSDGSVTLTTPAHNPGQADVIVDWTLGGIVQPQTHLAYTYEGMLPHAGSSGTMILLAAGRHQREARSLQA
ncbi:InlB B-repeat-containing protein [Bifidobacterium asteroides]|uniref:RCC1 domain-containing protein n=1 Tax=Bifidobacterium asteroides TaxID=1684 RepID=UPI003A80D87F